ncbi:phosphodiesterase gde1 [Aspergillus sclerotialis]|uniref:Phosphodiesterase gde1 n=1 Tax=Aspergillus sclerotialis TaxID=2070753 RepID=A0A3A2ZHE6_9EURO|nr:phosphodiesterase gde1 [Aspergillus sclerotialis]
MKFGRSLHKHQVLCWASYYLDYNGLKQKIKLLRANFLDSNGASDFREILDDLLRGIDHVEAFYEKAYSAVWNEALSFSSSTSLFEQNKWQFGDVEELRFHLGAFLQLRAALEKLRWYGTVNSQGFKRLFQKLNSFPADQAYATVIDDVTIKLREAQFSCQAKVIHDMGCVQTSITRITETLSRNLFTSRRSLILDHFMQHTCQNLEDSDVIYQAIQNDDARLLEPPIRKYREAAETDKSATERFLLTLIELSIIHESMECLESLLLLLESINGPEVIARNYLPLTVVRIIVKTGQQMMLTDTSSPVLSCDAQVNKFIQRNNGTQLLRRLLTRFSTKMQTLFTRDPVTNHPPIYYAAQYGLLDICQLLLECMQDEKPDNILLCSESILLEDDLGNSPLKVAISCGFKEVTDYLLGFLTRNQCLNSGSWDLVSGDLLAVAINTSSGCAEQLLAAKPDVNYQNGHGETALYTAARSGNVEIANKLLICGANVEIAERNRGWTPLIVASVEGHISVVELLLQAGAVPSKHDHLGWTALDHAAYRGHITLSRKIKQLVSHTTQSLAPSPLVAQPCPTQYATKTGNESVILVNPGSLDTKRKLTFIDLYQTSNGTTAVSQIGLRVEILLLTEHSPKYEVDLPILEDMTNNAWRFYTTNSSSAKLLFKLQRETVTANEARMEDHIGSAVALLDNLKQGLGPSRESLIRDYTIPIYSTASHDSIGTVTFSFLVVKPFAQTKRRLPARNTLWKEGERTKVVGHRGLGQNTLKPGRLSIGENTTQSFLSAMDLGADWVELGKRLAIRALALIN